MSGRAATTAAASLVEAWAPTVKSTVPVVRRAILVKHDPPLGAKQTTAAFTALERAWPSWHQDYVREVSRLARLPASQLAIVGNETVRQRQDGKTPMLDLPRLRTRPGAQLPLEVRHCVALCTDRLSSKIWTRVSLPAAENGTPGCETTQMRQTVARLREIAAACDEWFYDEFYRLARGAFDGVDVIERSGTLEVTTVGLQIDPLEGGGDDELYDEWLLRGHEGPNLENQQLLDYVSAVADMARGADLATLADREPHAYWMSISTAVQLPNDELVPRTALYLVRPRRKDDVAQVVGIGLDDSARGELAAHAALKISRFLANRV